MLSSPHVALRNCRSMPRDCSSVWHRKDEWLRNSDRCLWYCQSSHNMADKGNRPFRSLMRTPTRPLRTAHGKAGLYSPSSALMITSSSLSLHAVNTPRSLTALLSPPSLRPCLGSDSLPVHPSSPHAPLCPVLPSWASAARTQSLQQAFGPAIWFPSLLRSPPWLPSV